jgi:DNA-binding beta-propeller fold protein YncE
MSNTLLLNLHTFTTDTMNRLFTILVLLFVAAGARADKLVLIAGGGSGADGSPATDAKMTQPFGVDFAADGTPYIVEMAKGERLRTVNAKGELVTLAGTGQTGSSGDGEAAIKASFNGMHSLAVGPDGCVYLADTWNNRIRKFDPKTGLVTAFAGTGEKGFSGDIGPALKAKFGGCFCVSFDPAGKNLYITDLDNRRIRKVEMASGIVTTVAGNGEKGLPKDGEKAAQQALVDPRAHAVDAKGHLYILERGGHALRVVSPDGTIRTVAGTGKSGMGSGKALESAMNGPKHLCIDRDGSVLIADTENHRIVRYVPGEEKIVPIAGTGKKGTTGVGGDPLKAEFNQPHGVIVHPKTGEIYISDASNGRVLKIIRD